MIKQAEQLRIGDSVYLDGKTTIVESLEFYGAYKTPRIKINGRKFSTKDSFKLCSVSLGESHLEKYFDKLKPHYRGSRICLLDDTIVPLEKTCPTCGKR